MFNASEITIIIQIILSIKYMSARLNKVIQVKWCALYVAINMANVPCNLLM